jgi:hypothetical protein
MLVVHSRVEPDGGVHVRLTPEIRYGEARQQWTGQDGMFRLEMTRAHETYDELHALATLTPGQMLVVGCLADRPGSLGYQFFTDQLTGKTEQKLVLIRLAQVPPSELYLEDAAADGNTPPPSK